MIFKIITNVLQCAHVPQFFCFYYQEDLYALPLINKWVTLIIPLHYLLRSIVHRRMFASSSAEATRTRIHLGDPVENQIAPSRWKTRYAISPCPIYIRARVAGHHSRRARPPNYPQSSLVITKLRTIARTAKLVQIIRITVLSVMPFVIAGKVRERLSLDFQHWHKSPRSHCAVVRTFTKRLRDKEQRENAINNQRREFFYRFQFSAYQAVLGIWWR